MLALYLFYYFQFTFCILHFSPLVLFLLFPSLISLSLSVCLFQSLLCSQYADYQLQQEIIQLIQGRPDMAGWDSIWMLCKHKAQSMDVAEFAVDRYPHTVAKLASSTFRLDLEKVGISLHVNYLCCQVLQESIKACLTLSQHALHPSLYRYITWCGLKKNTGMLQEKLSWIFLITMDGFYVCGTIKARVSSFYRFLDQVGQDDGQLLMTNLIC